MKIAYRFLMLTLIALGLTSASLTLAQPTANAEPEITVRQEEGRTIREYRLHGRLYAIEIRPHQGDDFFLVDHDGNGNFERQPGGRIDIPEWALSQ